MFSYDLTILGPKAPALCPSPLMEEAVIISISFPVDGHYQSCDHIFQGLGTLLVL